MENANYQPAFTHSVVKNAVLRDHPFNLIDVGCGMGIDPLWRVFEPHLIARGLDPQLDEVERLRHEETNPRVRYEAALVGLPENGRGHEGRRLGRDEPSQYFTPWPRTSAASAIQREVDSGRRSLPELNSWQIEPLADRIVSLTDFVHEQGLETVDFVKTDTDGADYEVLLSALDLVRTKDILGFMVETPFAAAPGDMEHSFANVDLLLRRQGYLLYTLTVNRYSRAALPAPFAYEMFAQTTFGQALWGDSVYLRDAGAESYVEVWGAELEPPKLLKLACLYELFETPDSAAELLVRHRPALAQLIDVDRSLDLLTPPLHGERVSYAEYRAAFERDPYEFYPRRTVPGTSVRASRLLRRIDAKLPRSVHDALRRHLRAG
jgi:hypothetical protein